MNKKEIVLFALNGVLLVAVVVLFVLYAGKGKSSQVQDIDLSDTEAMPVAYVDMDSLLQNYDLFNQLNEELMQEGDRARATLNQKASALQKEMIDFQNKIENNAFLSEERARSEQQRLLKKQQELQDLEANLSQELLERQNAMVGQINTTIDSVVQVYNQDKKFHFIYANRANDNFLYGNEMYNITQDILLLLNSKE